MTKAMKDWHKITVPRKNLYNWGHSRNDVGNHVHYLELKNWCFSHFPKDSWSSYVERETGRKIFFFEKEKFLTMFLLQWPL